VLDIVLCLTEPEAPLPPPPPRGGGHPSIHIPMQLKLWVIELLTANIVALVTEWGPCDLKKVSFPDQPSLPATKGVMPHEIISVR